MRISAKNKDRNIKLSGYDPLGLPSTYMDDLDLHIPGQKPLTSEHLIFTFWEGQSQTGNGKTDIQPTCLLESAREINKTIPN